MSIKLENPSFIELTKREITSISKRKTGHYEIKEKGRKIITYNSGEIDKEIIYKNGTKEIFFRGGDALKAINYPNGTQEIIYRKNYFAQKQIIFKDGTKEVLYKSGNKNTIFTNGITQITKSDGKVKIINEKKRNIKPRHKNKTDDEGELLNKEGSKSEPSEPKSTKPEKKSNPEQKAERKFLNSVDSLKEGEILPIKSFSDSYIKIKSGGACTIKLGHDEYECSSKEQAKMIFKTFKYLKNDLGLDFLIPHIQEIIATIKAKNKNMGQNFNLNNGLQEEEKRILLKVLGQVFFKKNPKEKDMPEFVLSTDINKMENTFKLAKKSGNGKIKIEYICQVQCFNNTSGSVFSIDNFLRAI